MNEYTVTVNGYESELDATELQKQVLDQFPLQDVTITVTEQE